MQDGARIRVEQEDEDEGADVVHDASCDYFETWENLERPHLEGFEYLAEMFVDVLNPVSVLDIVSVVEARCKVSWFGKSRARRVPFHV